MSSSRWMITPLWLSRLFSQFSSVVQLCSILCDHMDFTQHIKLPCPSTTPWACSNSCPSSWWCHPTISYSVILFSCPQCFLATGSFPVNRLFTSGGQSIGASASASVLPMNTEGWSPLGWTGLVSLQPRGLSRVFSSTTVRKHQLFGAMPSLWYNSHLHTWLLEKQGEIPLNPIRSLY